MEALCPQHDRYSGLLFRTEPILICVCWGERWMEGETGFPEQPGVQLSIPGSRRGERVAGGAGHRKEEQMRCGGRGGGPRAIVHVLRTKGSSGSVCEPPAGCSPATRPHAGRPITDPSPTRNRPPAAGHATAALSQIPAPL